MEKLYAYSVCKDHVDSENSEGWEEIISQLIKNIFDISLTEFAKGTFLNLETVFLYDLCVYGSEHEYYDRCLEVISVLFEKGYGYRELIRTRRFDEKYCSIKMKDLEKEFEALDSIISQIAHPFFCMLLNINRKQIPRNNPRILFIMNGIFAFGSKKTLKNIIKKKSIWKLITTNVATNCETSKKLFLAPLLALIEKVPAKFERNILPPKVFLAVTNSTKDKGLAEICSSVIQKPAIVIRNRNYSELLNVGGLAAWALFDAACSRLEGDSMEVNLEIVARLIGQGLISTDEVMASNFVKAILIVLTLSQPRDKNVKAFLKAFVLRKDKDCNKFDSSRFKMLIHLLQEIAAELISNTPQTSLFPCSECMNGQCRVEWNKDMTHMCFKVLLNLYYLNKHWYQWFDEPRAPCLMAPERFEIWSYEHVVSECQSLTKHDQFRYIARICPPVLSFKTRRLFLDPAFSKNQINNTFTTFQVSRNEALHDMIYLFHGYQSTFEWKYFFENELGRGDGPTKEFYSILSRDFQNHHLNMWLGEPIKESSSSSENEGKETSYTYSPNGLFPKLIKTENSDKVNKLFELLGKTMAKCFLDGHMLDIPISVEFFKTSFFRHSLEKKYYNLHKVLPLSQEFLDDLISIKRRKAEIESDSQLNDDEKQRKIENLTLDDGTSLGDLCINFTVPGQPDFALMEGGEHVWLSPSNVDDYLEKLGSLVLKEGHKTICSSFLSGFDNILSYNTMNMFLAEEIQLLFCGEATETWTLEYLLSCCRYFDKVSYESKAAKYLLEVLATLNETEKRLFLRFVCSQSRLPCGGLKSLDPPLTIACYSAEDADQRLPWAATCFNRIHIPNYSSLQVTKERLFYALNWCQMNFEII